MHLPGFLLTVEGIDGCGKTTLIEKLSKSLEKNYSVLVTKEPGGSILGQQLRTILQTQETPLSGKAEFLLFAADRAQHFETIIIPALQKGMIVISDRCADSSLAYQGYGRDLDCALIEKVNQWAMNQITPDLIFYLKLDPETAHNRLLHARNSLTTFEQKKEAFWYKVIKGFETIFRNHAKVITFDAQESQEILHDRALEQVIKAVQKKSSAEVTKEFFHVKS
jgi:dTMP kinase